MAIEGCDFQTVSGPPVASDLALPEWVPEVVRQFMLRRSLADAVPFKIFVRADHVEQYCHVIGDWNQIHVDAKAAREAGFRERLIPGTLLAAFLAKSPDYQALVECGLRVLNLSAGSTSARPALVNTYVSMATWSEECVLEGQRLTLTVGYRVTSETGTKLFLSGWQKLSIQPK